MPSYAEDALKQAKGTQTVPLEAGNNGAVDTEKGKDVPEGSYAAGVKEAQK